MFPQFRPGEVQSAADWARKWFGANTRAEITRTTVGVTSDVLLRNNPRRLFWLVVNLSVASVALNIGAPAALATDFPLGPAGGFLSMTVQEDAEIVAWEVRAIATLAASPLFVVEVQII